MKKAIQRLYEYLFNVEDILQSKRIAWIDYAKGLTIVLVVYHHSFLTLVHSGVNVSQWLINANLSVYSFRMPMFFMLSGLFIARGLGKRGVRRYIAYRSRYLLYPYLLWAFIQTTGGLLFSSFFYRPFDWSDYLNIFYQPSATSQLWYLVTLFNTALLYALLAAKFHFKPWQQFMLGVILFMISPFLSFNSMIQYTTRFYIYLVFGTFISNFILSKRNFNLIASKGLFVPLLILMFLSQYYLFNHQYLYKLETYFDLNSLSIPLLLIHFWGMLKFVGIVFIGCAFVLNLCAILQKSGKFIFIRVVGYHSLYIYILHIFIVVSLRVLAVNWLNYDNAFVLLPVQIIFGMIGSVIIYNLCQHAGLNFLYEYDPARFKQFFKKRSPSPKYQQV